MTTGWQMLSESGMWRRAPPIWDPTWNRWLFLATSCSVHALWKLVLCFEFKHRLCPHTSVSLLKWLQAFVKSFVYHYCNINDTTRTLHCRQQLLCARLQAFIGKPIPALGSLDRVFSSDSGASFWNESSFSVASGTVAPPGSGVLVLVSSYTFRKISMPVPECPLSCVQ